MGDIIKRGTRSAPRYFIRYRDVDGVRRMKKAVGATTQADAQRLLNAAELRVSEGRVGIEPVVEPTAEEKARGTRTVKQLADLFTDEAKGYADPDLKDRDAYLSDAKSIIGQRIVPYVGHLVANELELHHVETMRDRLLNDDYKPASVTIALACLSRIYTWARRKRDDSGLTLVDCANPVAGVKRPKAKRDRIDKDDYLSAEEVADLLAYAEMLQTVYVATDEARALYPMIATAVYGFLRKGELLGLRWRDVGLDAKVKVIDVERSYKSTPKSGTARTVPLHPELETILRRWKERCPATKDGLVFPQHGGRMGRREDTFGLEHDLAAAGCRAFAHPWHALRHTGASHFMMAGGNILTLQQLLGHADLETTCIYAHLSPDHKAAELARLTFKRPVAGVVDLGEARRERAAADGYPEETGADAASELKAGN